MPHLIETEVDSILFDHTRMVERVVMAMRAETEPLGLNDYAEIAGLSPYYFNRTFRQIIGIPPGEFATSLRFRRAKELLLTTEASITEICFEVGYESLGTFSTRFKNLVGVTPATFRNLPHSVVDLDFSQPTFNVDPRHMHIRGKVEGTMTMPDDRRSCTFVGLYPSAIAVSAPVVGRMITENGPFELPYVPYGDWIMLSASLPQVSDPLGYLLPKDELLVASSGRFTIEPGNELAKVHLAFRRPMPLEPPVITALPTLLMV